MSADFDVAAILATMPAAPPLPEPAGKIVRIRDAEAFCAAVERAEPHSTLLLEDGHYRMPHAVQLTASHVQIRSASGHRDAVVIDGEGGNLTRGEGDWNHAPAILRLKRACDVTIAGVTFKNSPKYAVLFYGDSGVHGLTLHDVKFHNIWVRGLKGTHPMRPDDRELGEKNYSPEKVEEIRPRNGRVRHCLFLCDRVKDDRQDGFDGDYISGVDCMGLKDWVFSDNTFIGIRGANGGGRAGIFIWQGSTGVVCERNLFVGCDRGISYGNFSQKTVSVAGGAIRDNRFALGSNTAIECCTTRDIDVHGNTIVDTGANRYYAVRFLAGNDGARFRENILSGSLGVDETVRMERNVIGTFGAACFADPLRGNFTLTEKGREALGAFAAARLS
ncbi:MAG: hypothetical protein HS116_28615 [Planctomycetes bacterium]|nr:hypothetical protein [Planctomycetota bacterium]